MRKTVGAALAAAALTAGVTPAAADIVSDPAALYAMMKSTYDTGIRRGWHYDDQLLYFSAVLDAGRAYALRRPDDPNATEVQGLTVDLARQLHYDPLINRDAAEWYVRDAASAMIKANDPVRAPIARQILAKLDASDVNVNVLAEQADDDASALVAQFPGDPNAVLDQVAADLRAYELSHDPRFRSLALARAASPAFPIANIADPYARQLYASVSAAIAGTASYTATDVANAHEIQRRRAAIKEPMVIGRADVTSNQNRLQMTAPADEYFGRTKLSPIGVRNEILRINKYLDAGWGAQMTHDAQYLADSVEDWQHQYPRDYQMAQVLFDLYQTLQRINSPEAKQTAAHVRQILVVQYFQSRQAQSLLTS